jgi:flagellin-like protein
MSNKKALSPLVATILLVVFALIIGTATMSWGKNYVENIPEQEHSSVGSSIVIGMEDVDDPLKELQIKYITDRITLDDYLVEEKVIIELMQD